MLSETSVLQTLRDVGALITDSHIVYTSGKHGKEYVNKDALYPYTHLISQLCQSIAEYFADGSVEVVIAPAIGGVILSQWTAHHLQEIDGKDVLSVYAEKASNGEGFVIKRGYDKLVSGRKVLVVEDILNTGGSARKVVEAVRSIGGHVIGVGGLCNRGDVTYEMVGKPPILHTLSSLKMDAWEEADCPLCQANIPINTDVGKGLEFLARKQ